MDSSSIELKIMYCKDVQAFNFFQKLQIYVLVSIVSNDPHKNLEQNQQQRTPTDKEGGGNPEWNHEMRFDLAEVSFQDCDHLFFHFDLRHEGHYFGDKTLGEVRVPIMDLIEETTGIIRFVSYEVRTPDAKPNGVLQFSYKVIRKGKDMETGSQTSKIIGFPVVHHDHQSPEIQYPPSEILSSSPEILYPSLELEANSQETYSVPQVHHPYHGTETSSQGSYYPPPDTCCLSAPTPLSPLVPPMPRPPVPHQPLEPPMVHGAWRHSPHPPSFHPWAPHAYDHSIHWNWSPTAGRSPHASWQNGFRGRINGQSSFWNGRW